MGKLQKKNLSRWKIRPKRSLINIFLPSTLQTSDCVSFGRKFKSQRYLQLSTGIICETNFSITLCHWRRDCLCQGISLSGRPALCTELCEESAGAQKPAKNPDGAAGKRNCKESDCNSPEISSPSARPYRLFSPLYNAKHVPSSRRIFTRFLSSSAICVICILWWGNYKRRI